MAENRLQRFCNLSKTNTQSLYFGEAETKNFLQTAIAVALCFLLVNLLIIFRFGPFGDEGWDLTGECAGIYLAGGRFLVTIYRLIFSPCGVPVAYGIAAAIYFGLALAIQIKILRIQNTSSPFFLSLQLGEIWGPDCSWLNRSPVQHCGA